MKINPFHLFPPHFCHLYKGILQRGVSPATKRTKADRAKGQGHLIAFFDENKIPFTFYQVLNVIKCYIYVPISQKLKVRKNGHMSEAFAFRLGNSHVAFLVRSKFRTLCGNLSLQQKIKSYESLQLLFTII